MDLFDNNFEITVRCFFVTLKLFVADRFFAE